VSDPHPAQTERREPGPTVTPDDAPEPIAKPEDAAAKPKDEQNPLLREGTDALDAADIEDPDHQL
jgi:hypothetical protein